jgi:hypothetical protein
MSFPRRQARRISLLPDTYDSAGEKYAQKNYAHKLSAHENIIPGFATSA